METSVIENKTNENAAVNAKEKTPAFANGNPVNRDSVKQKVENEKVAQSETKPEKETKPALNLESTLKLVEELHRRKIQRDKLLETINTLEAFEVKQQEDAEETDTNYYQGCVLTIEDDERRKFTTKNPVIILAVAQYVNFLCVDKLAEIEANIIIPA